MRTGFRPILLFFLSVCFFSHWAQSFDPERLRVIDSLKTELANANNDTSKIRLRYWIGDKTKVQRTGFWDSMLAEVDKHGLTIYKIRALRKLGIAFMTISQHEQGLSCFSKSVKLAEESGNPKEVLGPLWSMASTLLNTGKNLNRALDLSFKGLRIATEQKNKRYEASFNSTIGQLYFFFGDMRKALDRHFAALEIFKEIKNNEQIVGTLCDIGGEYQELHDTAKTITYFMETLKYVSLVRGTYFEAETYKAIGAAYELKHKPDSAERYFYKAFLYYDKAQTITGKASVMALLADNSLHRGLLKKARVQALEGLALAKAVNYTVQMPSFYTTLKNICLKENNYKGALEAYVQYINLKDSASNEKNRNEAQQKQFEHEFEKKENENRLLAQQNQIQSLELRQYDYILLSMGVLLVLIFLVAYLFIRQYKLKNEQKSTQLEQKLLRSQMNPHFIFNSLQAIQHYIIKHEGEAAVGYLSSFANVTRNVLENSRMESITLKKETGLLENYLGLQKLRFGHRFDYSIKLDPAIDVDNITIPPMLAQPFIENAVEHGFRDIKQGGKIEVSYELKDNNLLMVITDNGKGMKDNYNEDKKHKSLAMEITRERIALLNKKARQKITFEISEAYPLDPENKGVKIRFSIPV